jgi:hypothetical protein
MLYDTTYVHATEILVEFFSSTIHVLNKAINQSLNNIYTSFQNKKIV